MLPTRDRPLKEKRFTRRQFIRAATYGLGALAMGTKVQADDFRSKRSRSPNIIFICTDDQRWDALGCSGNTIIHTPNMDFLAENGVRFENAFVTSPICAASRASILTGLYERTHGFNFGTHPLSPDFTKMTYPFLLRQAGYHTGFVGKFGLFVEEGYIGRMFDSYKPLERTPYFKRADGKIRHTSEICGDEAIKFLRSTIRAAPFCLSISFHAPHAEDNDPNQYYWPPVCDDLYRNVKIPEPKTADSAFFESLPQFLKSSLNRERWKWRFDTPEKFQNMVKGYYRMISGVDLVIGRIMTELQRLGLDSNTIIILTSDNGYFLGERGFAGKWLMHEPSIRVPLIIYDPRRYQPAYGIVMSQMVLNVDIAPTILNLAGVDITEEIQGRSLLPLMEGKNINWRNEVFCEHLYKHNRIPRSEGIRTERWKYIRYFKHPEFKELYNLSKDPLEEENLAGYRRYREQMLEFDQRCNKMIKALTRAQ